MKKLAGILILLLFIPVSVDSQQPILLIELSSDGEATITQLLSAKSIVSSISVPLISDRTSKILATDERGILLKTTQSGNSLDIASLGASGVTLTYKADITSFDSQAWNVSYEAETETVVSLPQLATIVSVSSIPLDIEDNVVIMPPGPVSITYIIKQVSSKTFFVLEGGQNYPVEITSASNIDDFFKQSNEIRFRISGSSTLLVVVPTVVLPNPIDASLNGGEVSFNPYYNNGTHNWIRIDPHESGVIEIGGDVRASQIISDNPMTNQSSGDNDSIFLTVGIILGVLALGFVVFRKYFKIGLIRTSSSKGSNQLDISSKHVKRDMKGRHLGIFALALLPLLLTVPSAFGQVTDSNPALGDVSSAQATFRIMELITDAEAEASALGELITSNHLNMGTGLTEYADAIADIKDLAVYDPVAAAALLEESQGLLDNIYTQLDAQIDSRQDVRFEEFVSSATYSIGTILELANADPPLISLSEAVIDELQETYDILTSGDYAAILAATGGTSDVGLTFAMHPGLANSAETSQASEKLPAALENLPDKIKTKFGISTNNIGTQSTDGTGDGNEDDNGDSVFPGFGAAGINPAGIGQETGVGLGGTPPGFFNIEWSPDDWWGWSFDDFAPPFGEEFEPGAYGRANAAEKAAKGLDIARERSEGRGQSAPEIPEPPEPPGPPCGSPPCGGPP